MKKLILVIVMLCLLTVPLMAEEKKEESPVETKKTEATKPAPTRPIILFRFNGGYEVTSQDIEKMNEKEVRNLLILVNFYKSISRKPLAQKFAIALNKKMLPKWTKKEIKKEEKNVTDKE